MKPIPEGCYTTVLYVQLNLLFCGLWELKYMPATLRWCPPLWHPTHPRDFLRFWARCRFKISQRVWGRQLLARSARTVPALFQCVHFFFQVPFHPPLHSSFPLLFPNILIDPLSYLCFPLIQIMFHGLSSPPSVSCLGLHTRKEVNILAPGGQCWVTGSRDVKTRDSTRRYSEPRRPFPKRTACIYNLECTHFETG